MIFNTGGGGNATRKVTGKSLHLADTAGGKYKNIKLVGASVQNGTPAVSKPVDIVSNKVKSITAGGYNFVKPLKQDIQTISGVTATMKDGYVVFNGTNNETGAIDFYVCGESGVYEDIGLPSGEYTISTEKALGEKLCFYIVRSDGLVLKALQNNLMFQNVELEKGEKYRVFYRVLAGGSFNNVAVRISLNSGTEPLPFKPYEDINTAELDEEYELNGVNGIYDEIDLERGVRVQRCGSVVLNGSETWETHDTSTGKKRLFTRIIPVKPVENNNVTPNLLSDYYKTVTTGNVWGEITGITVSPKATDGGNACVYIYDARFNTADTSAWKAHLASNPMTVVYELAEPVETPLSVDELIAFNKLRAYKSGSTLFSGCDMEVEYFLNNKVGQPMADTHLNTAKYILDGATLNIIV